MLTSKNVPSCITVDNREGGREKLGCPKRAKRMEFSKRAPIEMAHALIVGASKDAPLPCPSPRRSRSGRRGRRSSPDWPRISIDEASRPELMLCRVRPASLPTRTGERSMHRTLHTFIVALAALALIATVSVSAAEAASCANSVR